MSWANPGPAERLGEFSEGPYGPQRTNWGLRHVRLFVLQKTLFHFRAIGSGETNEGHVSGNDPMTGNNQRVSISRHHAADRAAGASRTSAAGQFAVTRGFAPRDISTRFDRSAAEIRQITDVDLQGAQVNRPTGGKVLELGDPIGPTTWSGQSSPIRSKM